MMPADSAIERLARELHWKMEHLDPTEDSDWERLSDRQREFYRLCVRWLLFHRSDILTASESPNA
jgi:hypothetical protein